MSLALSISPTPGLRTRPAVPVTNHPDAGSSAAEGIVSLPSAYVNSTDLLQGKKAVDIKHNGSTYRLQATRLGKLILTK